MFKVEQLPLWDVLKTVDDEQRAKVRKLIEDAAAILDWVIETFPTYTLHNSIHAENVVQLMADLLGPRRADLTPLEAALLMLSAFYHDIGMVFRQEERNRLTEEPEWKTFLDNKPDAYLAVKKAGEVPLDIAEWYCRWRHADRVYVYLNRQPGDLLKWGQTSIREELGKVCESHNLSVADLYQLRTNFRSGEADLRFCAILLRLADILDFDRTRSPEEVYEHLGLSRRIDPRQDASDVEWRKHLCSEGFRFPEKRPDGYQLGFVAGPDEPGVEHDVREFLRVIEDEVKQCRSLLDTCSEHWRTLPLPASVDRSNIHSNSYRYGEYRFTLDEGQIMDLLMGENLYEEPYVFVRELIQNALDASRHRRFIERASGNLNFEPTPIQVRHWIDQNGCQWVRFDDHGMGMDEDIVRNHLLKVGSSYYRTASFRAEILRVRARTKEDFVPISRFGIGLLSCFIVGDRVEISTKRRASVIGVSEPIRLSLNGLRGFFTLQTPHLPALPMPTPDSSESGYRAEPGTSIAVRLASHREQNTFDLEALLRRYVVCPPVPVEFGRKYIGGEPAVLVDRPWCEPITQTLSQHDMALIQEKCQGRIREPFQVEFLPINLTEYSPTSELKGQLIVAIVKPSIVLSKSSSEPKRDVELRAFVEFDNGLRLHIEIFEADDLNPTGATFPRFPYPNARHAVSLSPVGFEHIVHFLRGNRIARLSHNGVAVPINAHEVFASLGGNWGDGLLVLSDSLRPSVSVSRERLTEIPLRIRSAANLALYRALSALRIDLRSRRWELFNINRLGTLPLLGDLLSDEFLRLKDWTSLPIISSSEGLLSFDDIQRSVTHKKIYIDWHPRSASFWDWCAATLVQVGLRASVYLPDDGLHSILSISDGDPSPISDGHKLFPPLSFLPHHNSVNLGATNIINSNHPFATWLLEKAPEISKRYPGLFERLRFNLVGNLPSPEKLNPILDRLRDLHPAVRPPEDLVLTPEDFVDQP